MEKKINIGVLGCANIAERLVLPNMKNTGHFNIVAVASRTEEKAESLAAKFLCEAIVGYDNLLRRTDIDAVYIPLPTGLHTEWIRKGLKAKKHLFVEKSFTANAVETKELIEIAKRDKLCVFENFMFPFHSQIAYVKKLIEDNEIGDIKLLRSSFGFPPFSENTNIRYKAELGGGALLDAGAYTLMAAQQFLGFKQEVLSASLENANQEVDFHGSIALKNDQGIHSQLAFGFNNFYQNNIELWGTLGKITLERAFTAGPEITPKVILEQQNIRTEFILPADNHFVNILNAFYSSIINENYDSNYDQILSQSELIYKVQKLNLLK